MKEIAIAIQIANQGVTPLETIYAIKSAGFNNVFIQWYNGEWAHTQQKQVELCRELGLNIIFAHLGYEKVNALWRDGAEGDEQVERYKNDIYQCYKNGISTVIMHLVRTKNRPEINAQGLERIIKIIDYAKSLNVKVAFENGKTPEHFEYILRNIHMRNAGVCFDSGHCHAFSKDQFDFEIAKGKIFEVHLHDNDGEEDLHFLPFDGNIDWQDIINKLKTSDYNGFITLEPAYWKCYPGMMSLNQFYKEAYKRGQKLIELAN